MTRRTDCSPPCMSPSKKAKTVELLLLPVPEISIEGCQDSRKKKHEFLFQCLSENRRVQMRRASDCLSDLRARFSGAQLGNFRLPLQVLIALQRTEVLLLLLLFFFGDGPTDMVLTRSLFPCAAREAWPFFLGVMLVVDFVHCGVLGSFRSICLLCLSC